MAAYSSFPKAHFPGLLLDADRIADWTGIHPVVLSAAVKADIKCNFTRFSIRPTAEGLMVFDCVYFWVVGFGKDVARVRTCCEHCNNSRASDIQRPFSSGAWVPSADETFTRHL